VILQYHRVPQPLFDEIAAGGGGTEAVDALAAGQRSKRKILLAGVPGAARAASPDQRRLASLGYDLLAEAQLYDSAAADVVISYPSVGAWARRTVRGLLRPDAALPGAEPDLMCAVAAAAAIRARLPAQIEVPVRRGVVMLPSLGAAAADGERAVVRSTAAGAEVYSASRRVEIPADPHRDAGGWTGLRRVTAGPLDALVDDLDPFRMPAVQDLASRLDAAQADLWAAAFRQAWAMLHQHHRATAVEVAAAVKVIVPRDVPPLGVVSSSSPDTFGAVAMSQPYDGCALAETLAHEVQHLKLSALIDVVKLTEPDNGSSFYAPWRDDPRPADGLLQGIYAYLGVSGFWRLQRLHEHGDARMRADARYVRWRDAAATAAETLRSSGRLTPAGSRFVEVIVRTLSGWGAKDRVPEQAHTLARQIAEQHRRRWESVNRRPIPT
jgi:HEXXH motif-containing protein